MKTKLFNLLPYLIALGLDFYLLPLFMKNTGTAMLHMLCTMPVITLVIAVLYGMHNGFNLYLPIIAFILFLPTVFIYYNSSAWIYALIYAGIVLLGNVIGRAFYSKR